MATATTTTTTQIEVTLSPEEIEALKGDKGEPGENGRDGVDGKDGRDGADGKDGRDGVDGKDGAPGTPAPGVSHYGGVALDSFPGANYDEKLTAALNYAKAQTSIPAIFFPQARITLTKPQTPFSGMKLIGPNPGGMMNLELASGQYVNHRVTYTGTEPLFTNTGTLYDVHVSGIAFQGSLQQQFWRSTGNLYACKFDNLTFYGFKHIFGNATEKALMTYTKFTGSWQVIGFPRTVQFHVGGSDCDFWTTGDINIGVTNTQAEGDFTIWFDGMGKTNVGSLYLTAGNNKGLRISGNTEASPINFNALRLEGYHSSNPATRLLQVDSGTANFTQCWFAYGRSISVNANARVNYAQCVAKEVSGLNL